MTSRFGARVSGWCLALSILAVAASQTPSPDLVLTLSPLAPVSIGNGSDVFIDVLCNLQPGGFNWNWHVFPQFGYSIPAVLSPFNTSANENTGLLRVYVSFLREIILLNQIRLRCVERFGVNTDTNVVEFTITDTLFFSASLPSTVTPTQNFTATCLSALPSFPSLTLTTHTTTASSGGTYKHCSANTARGSFRSRSVAVESDDTPTMYSFNIQPRNITVQRINGQSRGAFSCSISPSNGVTSITWFFAAIDAGSAQGMGSGLMQSTALVPGNGGVSVRTEGGTSVLVLDGVGMEQEGSYYCEVRLTGGMDVMISDNGTLSYNSVTSTVNRILLRPPPSLSSSEGDRLLIPCVGSTSPFFQTVGGTPSSPFGLVYSSVQRESSGSVRCQVGMETATVNLNVEAPPRFETALPPELLATVPGTEPLRLLCEASGNPQPTVSFLKNGKPVSAQSVVSSSLSCAMCVGRELMVGSRPARGQEGVYQCVAEVVGDGSTTITSSSYVNIQFLDSPSISPSSASITLGLSSTPLIFSFTCTANAHPIPSLSWSRGGTPAAGNQSVTGFRERGSSVFSVAVSGLVGRVEFVCTAAAAGLNRSATVVVIASTVISIPDQPQSPAPLQLGSSTTLSCTARSNPRPTSVVWFRVQNRILTQLVSNGGDIVIRNDNVGTNDMRSTLQLRVTNEMGFADYFCRGSNGFRTADSNHVAVTMATIPSILVPPQSVTTAPNETISFSCEALGVPVPSITWSVDGSNEIIPLSSTGIRGRLTIVATSNGTLVNCTATNSFGSQTSNNAVVIIGGVPATPSLSPTNTTAHSILISWTQPPGLLPISQYIITISTGSSIIANQTRTAAPSQTSTQFEGLQPFFLYTVMLEAVNRAGSTVASIGVTTQEAVPEGPPLALMALALTPTRIQLAWDPPSPQLRNGNITHYLLRYHPIQNPTDLLTAEVPSSNPEERLNFVISGTLSSGTEYNISLSAVTVGEGPSRGVTQRTYPQPPSISGASLSPGGQTTETSITITLPNINITQFSHMWIIAMLLVGSSSDAAILSTNPSTAFQTNANFTTYSPDVPFNKPYVVSEVSASVYQSLVSGGGMFTLGNDNETRQNNSFPDVYVNGPLRTGGTYTAFVWAFLEAIPAQNGESPAKRQVTVSQRQYRVFSSTDFLPATSTHSPPSSSAGGIGGGAVAGIVIALLVALAIVVALTVVMLGLVKVRREGWKGLSLGPPPSRQGSKRFEDRAVVTIVSNPRADSELQDLNPDDVRLPIPIDEFADYVRKMHANTDHLFSEEYQIVTIKSPGLPHSQGSAMANVNKNRYANINCYDDTRVHLNFIPGMEGSDYINANYIDGYNRKQAYVCTQGPLPNTVHDFWRMVWEEDSCCIIMLTNVVEKSRVKCHQYWPETGNLGLGDITVTAIDTQELAYYTIRTFRVNKGNDRREVKQFHYTGWPDFGVPDHAHPIIGFIRRVNNFKRTTRGPDVIHCSAGVGRSGTLICIQSMMELMEEERTVNIFNTVLAMRRQRNYMVQTERQYIFIHDAVLELIQIGNTEVSIQSLRKTFKHLQTLNPESETSGMQEEYQKLLQMPQLDLSYYSHACNPTNMPKNRHQHIVPLDSYRVRLLMTPGVTHSDYICASYVDGYQRRHQYILTQAPMKETVDYFWRMIWEHRVSAIMMLCQEEENKTEMCVRYWPTDKLKQHGDMFIELAQKIDYPNYTLREFSITNTKINESRLVKHYHYTDWLEESCPLNSSAIIDLIGVLQKTQHMNGGGPIVLHDSTPIGRAGTFCVLSSVLEQLKVEGVVDLFFFIHALRQQQPGLISSFDQYNFCYTSVLEFLDSFDHYSNFD